jgi:uncharacterized protein YbjT (DUF2867 family)
MKEKHALVLGASGLVGTALVTQLLEDQDYGRVTALVRKPMSLSHPKLKQITADYERLESYREAFEADTVYCCLGTTMKTAGSKEAFRRVDLDYPVKAAQLAQAAGVRHFSVISAMGARENSMYFYNRVKGEMERRLRETGLPSLYIFRPSLLLGDRQEHRTGEAAAALLSRKLPFLWAGPLRKYKPVEARTVAAAMRAATRLGAPGAHIFENKDLPGLAWS